MPGCVQPVGLYIASNRLKPYTSVCHSRHRLPEHLVVAQDYSRLGSGLFMRNNDPPTSGREHWALTHKPAASWSSLQCLGPWCSGACVVLFVSAGQNPRLQTGKSGCWSRQEPIMAFLSPGLSFSRAEGGVCTGAGKPLLSTRQE